MSRLIVPPTLSKGINSAPTIRRIWTVADQQLGAASDLVIWGYGLPATDFYSAWLLRRSNAIPLDSFTLINPEVEDDAFVTRLEKVALGGKIPKGGTIKFRSFTDYLTDSV